jgi:hypothetical protein
MGTCSSCHNGTTATGKNATHIATTNNCDACHTTTTWTTAVVDHTAVMGTCSSCHNGTTATGKNATHIVTTAECNTCHTTTAWTPASFDHSGISGSCSTCHNGTSATGKNAGHFVTTQECNVCHNTTAWIPTITFLHTTSNYPGDHRVALTCQSCHTTNSEIVPWPSPTYAPYCAACHAKDYIPSAHGGRSVATNKDCGRCHRVTDTRWD